MTNKKYIFIIGSGVLLALFLILIARIRVLDYQLDKLDNRIKKFAFEKVADIDVYRIEKDGAICFIAKTDKGVGIDCEMKPVPAKIYRMGE